MRDLAVFLAIGLALSESIDGTLANPSTTSSQSSPPADRASLDWPDFLGPTRNGISPARGLNWDWDENGPDIVWSVELGAGYATPVVQGGVLYHYDRQADEAQLHARDTETGKQLWQLSHPSRFSDMLGYNNGPRCSPVVDEDRVYTMSPEGRLRCVSANRGELLWEVETSKKFGVVKNFFGVGSTPIIWEDLVIANIGGSPPGQPPDVYAANGDVATNGTGLVAFEKMTGKVRWTAGEELASYASPIISTYEGKPHCIAFARGGLLIVAPRTGNVEATFPWRASLLESVNAATPVSRGNQILISETYGPGSALVEVLPDGIRPIWKDSSKGRKRSLALHWNTPVYHDGHVYGSSGRHSNSAELRCVAWESGKVVWRKRGLGRCSLLLADDHLICLGEYGNLALLKANSAQYDLVSEHQVVDESGEPLLNYPAWGAPIIAQGRLYVQGKDRLVCFDLRGD